MKGQLLISFILLFALTGCFYPMVCENDIKTDEWCESMEYPMVSFNGHEAKHCFSGDVVR